MIQSGGARMVHIFWMHPKSAMHQIGSFGALTTIGAETARNLIGTDLLFDGLMLSMRAGSSDRHRLHGQAAKEKQASGGMQKNGIVTTAWPESSRRMPVVGMYALVSRACAEFVCVNI